MWFPCGLKLHPFNPVSSHTTSTGEATGIYCDRAVFKEREWWGRCTRKGIFADIVILSKKLFSLPLCSNEIPPWPILFCWSKFCKNLISGLVFCPLLPSHFQSNCTSTVSDWSQNFGIALSEFSTLWASSFRFSICGKGKV